jgi:RTX calcium-binding nonapeptide repeat (4 copies)
VRRSLSSLLGVALLGLALLPTAARAQVTNDDLAAAQRLFGPDTVSASTVGAAKQSGEPDHADDPGGASIWFVYTASGNAPVTFETVGSDFDTLLAAYFGTDVTSLTPVASNDDIDGGLTSRIEFFATEGQTYLIAVDGKAGVTGNVLLTLETTLPTCHVIGTTGPDQLQGTPASESICGLSGNDSIAGGDGDDIVRGGSGDDRFRGESGDDEIFGEDGIDLLDLAGAGGSAVVRLDPGVSKAPGFGRDELASIEEVLGSKHNDKLTGDSKSNGLSGGDGKDVLSGGGNDDDLQGGADDDRFVPGGGNDSVSGDKGDDRVSFASSKRGVSADLAFGRARGEGLDVLASLEGITGSNKSDTLRGTNKNNALVGGRGSDLLSGLSGNDRLSGGSGGDRIYAGSGSDRVSGGSGIDTCYPRACEKKAPFDDWLPVVNLFRSISDLPRVMENPIFSAGDAKHARYVVKTDVGGHFEDPSSPWYTQAGALAGGSSNVYWSSSTAVSDRSAISFWMTGPFHAIGILRPGLAETGYGAYRDPSSPGIQMAAALDVLRGLETPSPGIEYPIAFPGRNSKVPVATYDGNEHPDPLTSCSSYTPPTGLPIILMLDETPNVSAHSFKRGNTSLPHCVYDGTDYRNPNSADQSLGRSVLGNSVVLIPRAPLARGARYTVSIRSRGETHQWSFTVSG